MVISRNRSLGVQLDYSLEYLRTVICKIYGKQFLRNVLSIFIEQIPLSLVSAGAYGTGKCLNGQHKSNIFFSAQVDDSHIGLLIPFFTRANVQCKGRGGGLPPLHLGGTPTPSPGFLHSSVMAGSFRRFKSLLLAHPSLRKQTFIEFFSSRG